MDGWSTSSLALKQIFVQTVNLYALQTLKIKPNRKLRIRGELDREHASNIFAECKHPLVRELHERYDGWLKTQFIIDAVESSTDGINVFEIDLNLLLKYENNSAATASL